MSNIHNILMPLMEQLEKIEMHKRNRSVRQDSAPVTSRKIGQLFDPQIL